MLRNYIKIAFRNLWNERSFSILNIIGLTTAFGVTILLTMYSIYQLSFDKFHENANNLYQANITWQTPGGSEVGTSQPTPFAAALKSEVPGVDKITRVLEENALTFYQDKEIALDAIYTDSDFFKMFSFPVINGNQNNPMEGQSSVVISQTSSEKLFGQENPVGKTVTILISGTQEPFTIDAVISDVPDASSLNFDIAIPFENNPEYEATKERWGAQYHQVYVQLESQMSPRLFEKNSRDFTNLHYEGSIKNLKRDGAQPNASGEYLQLGLLPITDLRFVSFDEGFVKVSRMKVNIIILIIVLIIFIACVNYVNMSIAKSSKRLREIGVRKTLGAHKRQLFLQFWTESLLIFIISISLGSLLGFLLVDSFQTLFRTSATFGVLLSPTLIISSLLFVLLISLLVASYPSFLLNRLNAVQSLKGKMDKAGSNRFQDALIVVQFGIAILLIGGTLVLNKQLDYMQNKDLGYNKEQVVSFPLNGKKNSYDVVKLLREELSDNQNVLSISGADNNLGRGRDGSQYTGVWGFDYKGKNIKTNVLNVDYDYTVTLGIEFLQGRTFDSSRKSDALSVIVNESMAKQLDKENPLVSTLPASDSTRYQVIGVIKDYHFQNISKTIEPLTMFLDDNNPLLYAFVKVSSANMAETMDAIEKAYKNIEPNANFLGSFLDENVDRTFRREKNMANLITSGSIIAIVLSCIGLFAMSIFITAQRTKEIGIRKVVGASVSAITVLLTKDFIKLVGIAFLIATPLAWWAASEWLQSYPYRMELNFWIFLAAGVLALAIAILTISQRTISAAIANPVKSLRTE
ncbi:MAG: ABC transporter permease [Bacteroidota bacterium]